MPDEFEEIRTALQNGERVRRQIIDGDPKVKMILDNQRVIMATLATVIRGGHVPIDIARDLHDRAKKITAILEG